MKRVRVHVVISGRVQGVFFRSFIKSNAKMFEVRGWVKNIPGGKVEALFEGEQYNVNQMIELCRQGPPGAEIKKIDVKEERYRGDLDGFEVKR